MYALLSDSPYDGEYPIAYFDNEDEALEALRIIYAHDEKMHPDFPREDWDWGYLVREVTTTTLTEFKGRYRAEEKLVEFIYEKTTLGGDDCYIGRGLYRGEPDTKSEPLILTESKPISDGYWSLSTD